MLQYRVALGSIMRQRGVPFLEIRELTEDAYPANEGWFGERVHPNHMGHRLMASELLKLIGSNRLLPEFNIPTLVLSVTSSEPRTVATRPLTQH
jgi:hypothetical protein